MLVIRWVSNDPGGLSIPFHSRNIVEPGKFKFNWSRYADAGMDKMLEDAESAATAEERDELYGAIQKQIMDEAIFLAIHNQVQTIAHTSELTGFRLAAGQWQVRFYEVKKAGQTGPPPTRTGTGRCSGIRGTGRSSAGSELALALRGNAAAALRVASRSKAPRHCRNSAHRHEQSGVFSAGTWRVPGARAG